MDTHYFTVNEVADQVRVNPRTVRRWIKEGRLRAGRVMGNIRVAAIDVDNMIKAVHSPSAQTGANRKALMENMARELGVKPVAMTSNEIWEALNNASWEREDALQHRY